MTKIILSGNPVKKWNEKEIQFLKDQYPILGRNACAEKLNRTFRLKLKQDINSDFFKDWQLRAEKSKIGKKRPDQSIFLKEYIKKHPDFTNYTATHTEEVSQRQKKWIKKSGHPKGMLGKHQTEKCKKAVSISSKKMWSEPNSYVNSKKFRQRLSDRASKNIMFRLKTKGSVYSRSKNGWYKIKKNKYYFRSGWEVNYARYLEFLKDKGEIKNWEFEPDAFWFEKIKRGVRSYLPDFKVLRNDGIFEYHEVKGWMDNKSKTKLKRMSKYYPKIKMVLIDKNIYKDILKFEKMFPEAIKQ